MDTNEICKINLEGGDELDELLSNEIHLYSIQKTAKRINTTNGEI